MFLFVSGCGTGGNSLGITTQPNGGGGSLAPNAPSTNVPGGDQPVYAQKLPDGS
jgi:hypothetical protein